MDLKKTKIEKLNSCIKIIGLLLEFITIVIELFN